MPKKVEHLFILWRWNYKELCWKYVQTFSDEYHARNAVRTRTAAYKTKYGLTVVKVNQPKPILAEIKIGLNHDKP